MTAEKKRSGGDIAGWIATIVVCAICALLVFVRFRYDARYVETGSMRPAYEIGSIVLVDDTAYDSADPKVGDVAVYQTGNRQVLHRIVDIDENGDYIFEGDNNQSADFAPVERQQIVGKALTFKSWNTKQDGSGTTYKPGDALPNQNLDLYAQWG